jgi:hypothetical protein
MGQIHFIAIRYPLAACKPRTSALGANFWLPGLANTASMWTIRLRTACRAHARSWRPAPRRKNHLIAGVNVECSQEESL